MLVKIFHFISMLASITNKLYSPLSFGGLGQAFGHRLFTKDAISKEEEDKLFKKVYDIIEKDIRPFIQQDGGDIELHDIKNGCMIVSLEGACQGCGSRNSTLQYGVLGRVQDECPEITSIRMKLPFDDWDDM